MSALSWNHLYQQGIANFTRNRYEDAVELFTESIKLDDKEASVYDSRAAALEKLGRSYGALEDAKKVIELSPNSWQGYERSARLLMKLEKYESAVPMAELAIQRINPSNHAQVRGMEKLWRLASIAKAAQDEERMIASGIRYYFGKLPTEIAISIFKLVALDKAQAFILVHVCKEWRTVTFNIPAIWHSFTFSLGALKNAEEWLERHRGIVRRLRIPASMETSQWHGFAPVGFWEGLKILTMEIPREAITPLPDDISARLCLEELTITVKAEHTAGHPFLSTIRININAVKVLSLERIRTSFGDLQGCTSLKKISLVDTGTPISELAQLGANNPQLEEIVVDSLPSPAPPHTIFEHHNLRRVTFKRGPAQIFFRVIAAPNLTTLTIVGGRRLDDVFHLINTPNLEKLRAQCGINNLESLVAFLRRCPKLKALGLSVGSVPVSIHPLMNALTGLTPLVCPLLQDIHFVRCSGLTGVSLRRFVQARSPSSESEVRAAEFAQQVMPVTSLIINDCPGVDQSELQWLRSNVPHLVCTFPQP